MPGFRRTIMLCLLTAAGALAGAAPTLASSALTSMPSSVPFGSVEVDSGNFPSQSVTFLNGSPAPVTVESVAFTGVDAADFSLAQDGCSKKMVRPSMSCEVQVRFQPDSATAKTATLELRSSAGAVEVSLFGAGITGQLSANATSLDFPTTIDGQNNTEQITVDNANAATHILTAEITGPDAASFALAYGNCAQATLMQKNSCDVGVRFAPATPGEKTAQLLITSDASNTPLIVPLTGSGANGPIIGLSSRQALLGEVLVGSSVAQTFTVSNVGDYPLPIQQAFLLSGTPLMFPIVSDTCGGKLLQPGTSCAITVDFQPSTPGPKDASILLITESSAGLSTVGIEGIGILPALPTGPPTASTPAPSAAASAPSPFSLQNKLPQLIRLPIPPAGRSVNTAIEAICPTSATICKVSSLLTSLPSLPARETHLTAKKTGVLLGSTLLDLRGGQSATVHTRLSPSGAALLARRHKLRVSITVTIAAPGASAVTQSRTLTLTR